MRDHDEYREREREGVRAGGSEPVRMGGHSAQQQQQQLSPTGPASSRGSAAI